MNPLKRFVQQSPGKVILEFRYGTGGAIVNLATGIVSADEYGGTDTITGPGHVTWLRATYDNDIMAVTKTKYFRCIAV